MDMLKRVHIEGFKSIRDATIDLAPLTVLIGANGAGKSNLVSFLHMMSAMAQGDLHGFVGRSGGADKLLHFGPKTTQEIVAEIETGTEGTQSTSHVTLDYSEDNTLWPVEAWREWYPTFWAGWRTYHFHDTAANAPIRQSQYVEDNRELAPDAGNLAAYLYMLKAREPRYYARIISAFRQAAPFFGEFVLEPRELDPTRIMLNWRERGRDVLFGPHQLSDGSLRTVSLLTLLLQPEDRLPSLMIIDEPELGLHPYVLTMVADLLRSVSRVCQVIVATQSPLLVDHFQPQDVVVVERDEQGCSLFRRLSEDELSEWLEDYSLGELWQKNVIGGRP
ncbi:MAG: AAA family ATPase [Armatimonadota bacterium]|nr:AAA family ATPase [Armatimonadota bacterium]